MPAARTSSPEPLDAKPPSSRGSEHPELVIRPRSCSIESDPLRHIDSFYPDGTPDDESADGVLPPRYSTTLAVADSFPSRRSGTDVTIGSCIEAAREAVAKLPPGAGMIAGELHIV